MDKILVLKLEDALEFLSELFLGNHTIQGFETWRKHENGQMSETFEGEFLEYFKGEYIDFITKVQSRLASLPEHLYVELYIDDEYL